MTNHDSNCECPTCAPLPPGTHYMCLGENEWHTVPELRTLAEEFVPPNPYEHDLKKMRAASATPLSRFEDEWRRQRRDALNAESLARDTHFAAQPTPRLTAAEAADFAPPDPYAAGITALRAKESRR